MALAMTDANIVVLAQTHNPTIPSRDWLCAKGVFQEADFSEDYEKQFVHTPAFAACETKGYSFFVDEGRLQIGAKLQSGATSLDHLVTKVRQYVTSLPETRYVAVGFNFGHIATFPDAGSRAAFARDSLGKGALRRAVPEEEAHFGMGVILTWKEECANIRIVIEPKADDEASYLVNTNVHLALDGQERPVEGIVRQLGHYQSWCKRVSDTLERLFGNVKGGSP